jgi:hypothetical protein
MTTNHVDPSRSQGTSPPLTCRLCGATPQRRGDQVSTQARAYTCSLCLCTGHRGEIQATNTNIAGRSEGDSEPRINSEDSSRVSVTRQSQRNPLNGLPGRRGGRPRKHLDDRAQSRASSRAYRERKGSTT